MVPSAELSYLAERIPLIKKISQVYRNGRFKQLIDNGLKVKNPSLAKKMKDFINLRYKKSNTGDKALAHLHSISESYVQSSDSETDRASLTLIDHVLNFLESAKDFVECELKTKAAGLYATFYEVYEGKSFCKDEPLDNIDRTISFVDFSSTLSSNLGIKLGMGVGAAIALKKVYGVVAPLFRKIPTDQLSKIGKYFVEAASKLKFNSASELIESVKDLFSKVKKRGIPEEEIVDLAELVGEAGSKEADRLLEISKGLTSAVEDLGKLTTNDTRSLHSWAKRLGGDVEELVKQARGPSRKIILMDSQLQKKFKHAPVFGIEGSGNKNTIAQFAKAIENHVSANSTKVIEGTYKQTQKVIHYVDPVTGINLLKEPNGLLISVFKLNPTQLANVLERGSL